MNVDLGIRATVYDLMGYLIPGASFLATAGSIYALQAIDADEVPAAARDILDLGLVFWVLFFIASYIAGHAMNALSSCILEKMIASRFQCSKRSFQWLGRLSKPQRRSLDAEFTAVFEREPDEKDWFLLVAYVDERSPTIAVTALRFESIYGMARSLGLVCLMWALWPWLLSAWNAQARAVITGIAFLGFVIFFWQYIRFVAYHRDYLASALLVLGVERRICRGAAPSALPYALGGSGAEGREVHSLGQTLAHEPNPTATGFASKPDKPDDRSK